MDYESGALERRQSRASGLDRWVEKYWWGWWWKSHGTGFLGRCIESGVEEVGLGGWIDC